MYSDIPRWLSLTIYVLLSFKFLRKEKTTDVNTDKVIRKWLQLFITIFLSFQLIWFIFLIPYILPTYSDWLLNKFDWDPIYIPIAVMIYWLGLKGYSISLTVNTEKVKKTIFRDITKEGVTFIPEFPSKGHTITIEHLLTHTSGIKDYLRLDYDAQNIERWDFPPKQLIDSFKNYPLDFIPGTRFSYSNSGYFLLGYIIEKVSGKRY